MKYPVIAAFLCAAPAYADIAPDDVLESWRTFYAGFEATISVGDHQIDGKTTRFNGVMSQLNAANSETRYHFDWIDMRANHDGSVDISFSPNGYAESKTEMAIGQPVTSQITYNLSELAIHATGSPGDIHYSYTAPLISVSQTQSLPEMDVTFTANVENASGEVESLIDITESGPRVTESGEWQYGSLSGSVTYGFEAGSDFSLTFAEQGSSASYEVGFPQKPIPEVAGSNLLYPADLDLDMTYLSGLLQVSAAFGDEDNEGEFEYTHQSGAIFVAFSRNIISYSFAADGAAIAVENSNPLLPNFSAAFGHALTGLSVPIAKSDTASPFSLTVELAGFTLGEEVWAGFDPDGTLSHAPAGFNFSISGSIRMLVDFFDSSAMARLQSAPAEIRSLSLDSLSVDFEGMGLTGDGDVTFNNDRIDPMSGMPEPKGVLDFSINGALGLLDKIGRLGVGDPMAIIGMKGALGMFATPNSGPDSFTSRVEFAEGGHISVNGQQVK
mgnify:CR=1 FL=1